MDATTWQPNERARREEAVQLGLWMFLATVAMLFAAFGSAYLVRRSGSDWSPINLPGLVWLNTVVLAASSAAVEAARHRGAQRRWRDAGLALGLALALGAGFLAGQLAAWQQLMAAGVFLPASPHSAFFYVLTGIHGLHVIGALAVLAWVTALTWTAAGRHDLRQWRARVSLAATLWHFLLGIWVAVVGLLTL